MADAKRVTILNQREGKVVLPADADDLKANPKAPHRVLLAGQALEVSAADAVKYLRYNGLVDASKLVTGGNDSAEVKRLRAELAASKAENAKLKGGDADAVELGDGDEVLTAAGDHGVIVKMKKKGKCDVKLDNGNTSEFALKDLKPAPVTA